MAVSLVPGSNRIEARAEDRAGNLSPIAAVTVTFDPPSLTASPSTIQVCDGTGQGVTTLSWSLPSGVSAEVRIGSTTGTLFAAVSGSGSKTTGKWVRNNTRFFLVNCADGSALASVTVAVTSAGCPAGVASTLSGARTRQTSDHASMNSEKATQSAVSAAPEGPWRDQTKTVAGGI